MTKVPINRIIDHSLVDGLGNRTALFVQGCNFRCHYCHNPETMRLCANCGMCVPYCPSGALESATGVIRWREERCTACDACIRNCPYNASPRIRWMDGEEAARRILANRPFIRGVTCSGGECTLYRDFLVDLFSRLKAEGLGCLIDSNGSLDFEKEPELLALSDGVMLDVKAIDPAVHRELTGQDNEIVLHNAEFLARMGKLTEIRTVACVRDYGVRETIEKLAVLLKPYLPGNIHYRLIAFRPYGVREEYQGLGQPRQDAMEELEKQALTSGFSPVSVT
ncbi:MAG: YjjW family glycine radical enzyme activase [Treponema sp.]|nr:YjjW family glycine radical enzyme activase [Treponema sp.]